MSEIVFVGADGARYRVHAVEGRSVMHAATDHNVPGIVADCGGACSCATCHGIVDESWVDRVPPPSEDELDMIDAGVIGAEPNSRLTCQITVTPELDGLVIRLPPEQG